MIGSDQPEKTQGEEDEEEKLFDSLVADIMVAKNLEVIVNTLNAFLMANFEKSLIKFPKDYYDDTAVELFMSLKGFLNGKFTLKTVGFRKKNYSFFTKRIYSKIVKWEKTITKENKPASIWSIIRQFLTVNSKSKDASSLSQDDKNRINFLRGNLLNRNSFLTLKRELLGWAAANESLLNKPMFIDSQITPNQILELLLLIS